MLSIYLDKTASRSHITTMHNLVGRFLIAMPHIKDSRFEKAVAYVCDHNEQGAMALIINQPLSVDLSEIISEIINEMDIEIHNQHLNDIPVAMGGPMQPELGCVLHPRGKIWDSTFDVGEISVTTSKDLLIALVSDLAPKPALVTLGYMSWQGSQLEKELEHDYWLTSPADTNIVFNLAPEKRWEAAMDLLGIDQLRFVSRIGDA